MKLCLQHAMNKDEVITIPIAHGEGNYYCDEETLAKLKKITKLSLLMQVKIRTEVLKILQGLRMKKEMFLA